MTQKLTGKAAQGARSGQAVFCKMVNISSTSGVPPRLNGISDQVLVCGGGRP